MYSTFTVLLQYCHTCSTEKWRGDETGVTSQSVSSKIDCSSVYKTESGNLVLGPVLGAAGVPFLGPLLGPCLHFLKEILKELINY